MHKFTTPVSPRCGEVCQANIAAPSELYRVNDELLWTIECYKNKYLTSNFEWNAANAPHKYKTQSPVCEFVCIKVFVHIHFLTTSNSPGVCCALNPPVFCSSLWCVTVLWPTSSLYGVCLCRLCECTEAEAEIILQLKNELREKELKLTDIRLEALSSAHHLDQIREAMNRMQVHTHARTRIHADSLWALQHHIIVLWIIIQCLSAIQWSMYYIKIL